MTDDRQGEWAEEIAKRLHECYEAQAPHFGYETRAESAVPWEQVPENNRRLMVATVNAVFRKERWRRLVLHSNGWHDGEQDCYALADWS